MGCGSKRPEPPEVSIVECARDGNIEAVKQCQVIFKDLFNDFIKTMSHPPQKPIDWKVVESSHGKYWKHIGGSLPKFILGFSLLFVGVVLLIPASLIIIKGIQQKGGIPFFSIVTASLLLLLSWWIGWKEGWSKRIKFFDRKYIYQIYRVPVPEPIKELKNILQSRGVDAVASHPFPEHWKNQLMKHSALYRRIPNGLKDNMHQLTNVFLSKVEFRHGVVEAGKFGEDNMVLVAGEACVLITGRDYQDFRKLELVELRTNLLYKRTDTLGLGPRFAGLASDTTVSLHWESVMDGATHGNSAYNVILHEFAHVMDFADDGRAQGLLGEAGSQEARNWEELLEEEFPKLVEAHARSVDYVIPPYAMKTYSSYITLRGLEKNRPEFFTCATEVFFEKPVRLQRECPKVYEALKAFYNLDPVQWDNEEVVEAGRRCPSA